MTLQLTRIELWRGPYKAVVDDLRRKPFAWGENDCGPALVGRMVEALTGVDIAAPYRGRYDSAASAYRLMKEDGFDDLADLVDTILPARPRAEAIIGDIAAVPVDSLFRHALGVVNGERIFVLTEAGLGTVDLLDADQIFAVG
ncbi:DUF6950 family protein [Tianweitania sediminis]|uniref:DUF6950 domain-containing protein n=1 Tax=Tianweitania sediminis TaxID=1502156 RepID=A0A8J7UIY7_9HYPH|nr:hypothetical protein [Tianweitania sediminis]MBP0439428.1 hypothetical protein [Tianweitania sediminis]